MSAAVAVVVPTHNRADRLPRLLSALEQQRGVAEFDVFVVDDASSDATRATLGALARSSPLTITPIHQDTNRGAAAARNVGWRTAGADVIAFTDDDCVPDRDWLANLLAGLDAADIVQGRTDPDPAKFDSAGPFSHLLGISQETGYYETCNIAYRRAALEAVDGFDESYRYPYGEDTDLAWRAKERGFRTAFASNAVVFHDVEARSYTAYLRDMKRREGLVHVLSRHPQLRRHLGLGYVFRASHPPAALVVIATALAVLRPHSKLRLLVAAGAAGWYARECRWTTRKPPRKVQWLAVVPLRFVADIYELAVLARASVRYRTVLL